MSLAAITLYPKVCLSDVVSSNLIENFPLSQLFWKKNIQLSHRLRDQAAQCVDGWNMNSARLKMRKHFYRAVLEVLLHRVGMHDVHASRQKDRVYEEGFKSYVTAVVQKHRLPEHLIEEASVIDEFKVESIYPVVCLRAMCAAITESLVILDRWMFVRENLAEGYVVLHRLFDSSISPRRWAIVAVR